MIRITSYNVCYTKLLREGGVRHGRQGQRMMPERDVQREKRARKQNEPIRRNNFV